MARTKVRTRSTAHLQHNPPGSARWRAASFVWRVPDLAKHVGAPADPLEHAFRPRSPSDPNTQDLVARAGMGGSLPSLQLFHVGILSFTVAVA